MNVEDRLQKEMTRHMQELDAIQNSKSTEQDTSKVDKFINEMREMNKTSSNLPKQENEFLNFLEEEKFKN